MKIGIDLKPFSTGSKYRGIGHYCRELIHELLEQCDGMEFHFLNLYQEYEGDPQLNESCRLYQYPMGPQIMDAGERQLFRDFRTEALIEGAARHFIEQSQIDVMLFTSPMEYGNMYHIEWFEDTFSVGILYDLIPSIFPEQCLFDLDYAKDYNTSIDFLKGLDLLLAISQSAKDDAVRLLGIPVEKIVVIHAGIDRAYRKLQKVNVKSLKARYGISDPFIMFAGGIDFKKNIEGLIIAYAKCGKAVTDRYQLVIVGKAEQNILDKYLEIAQEHGVTNRVICTGYIPKQDLIRMYNITELFAFPSLYEGFGLPVIEAMACGAKVLTSNTSSLKEIAEGHAVLVSPGSVRSIAKGMREVLEHPIASSRLAENSIAYAESFNWKSVAEKAKKAILERWIPHAKKEYYFNVTDRLVRDIARLYVEEGQFFDQKQQEELADKLIAIQDHQPLRQYDLSYRLLFDMTVVHEWMKSGYMTGIGRVSSELYRAMKKKMQVIPVIVENKNGKLQCSEISVENYTIVQKNIKLLKKDIYFMPEIQIRGIHVPQKHPYAQEFKKLGIRTYAVIHDILPLTMPEYFEEKTAVGFHTYVKELVNNYSGIVCVSKCVADDVIQYCKQNNIMLTDKIKIGYFHHGQDTFSMQQDESVSGDIKKFFKTGQIVYLMLGTLEPRKGHQLVLDVFETIWKNGSESKLCIVGHIGWNMENFIQKIKRHPQLGKKLAFFEGVKDSEVEYVYQHAGCLIQASAGEGFGLPLVEAGRYDLPVLCSDIRIFHEVAGEHVNYFKRNKEDLMKKIYEFENGQAVYHSQGIPKQSWEEAAQRVYSLIVSDQNWYQNIQSLKG